jgi:NAD(P)-dependent dehydrogenase (short-subunit alcohol dehydrogenase family)
MRLKDKVAVITGGARGIGLAIARAFVREGATVVIADISREGAEEATAGLEKQGGRAVPVAVNVADPASVSAMVKSTVDALGRIDILINNAGVCFHRPALEVPDDEFATVFDVNLTGLWRMTKAVAPHMIDAGGGSIVNVGSISAMIVNRPQWQPAYNASKAAVHQLTKSLAAEWAPYNIRVNAIAPGYVKTEMAPVDEPRYRQHWIEDAPMRRYATPEEIAPSVVYLASDAASFTTGAVLVTDGGYTLH